MLGGQEHELTMRTVELIEDNAEQSLKLLVAYATSSRRLPVSCLGIDANRYSRCCEKPSAAQLHHVVDARNSPRLYPKFPSVGCYNR